MLKLSHTFILIHPDSFFKRDLINYWSDYNPGWDLMWFHFSIVFPSKWRSRNILSHVRLILKEQLEKEKGLRYFDLFLILAVLGSFYNNYHSNSQPYIDLDEISCGRLVSCRRFTLDSKFSLILPWEDLRFRFILYTLFGLSMVLSSLNVTARCDVLGLNGILFLVFFLFLNEECLNLRVLLI